MLFCCIYLLVRHRIFQCVKLYLYECHVYLISLSCIPCPLYNQSSSIHSTIRIGFAGLSPLWRLTACLDGLVRHGRVVRACWHDRLRLGILQCCCGETRSCHTMIQLAPRTREVTTLANFLYIRYCAELDAYCISQVIGSKPLKL